MRRVGREGIVAFAFDNYITCQALSARVSRNQITCQVVIEVQWTSVQVLLVDGRKDYRVKKKKKRLFK